MMNSFRGVTMAKIDRRIKHDKFDCSQNMAFMFEKDQARLNLASCPHIHPSFILTALPHTGCGGANPSCHWARGRTIWQFINLSVPVGGVWVEMTSPVQRLRNAVKHTNTLCREEFQLTLMYLILVIIHVNLHTVH